MFDLILLSIRKNSQTTQLLVVNGVEFPALNSEGLVSELVWLSIVRGHTLEHTCETRELRHVKICRMWKVQNWVKKRVREKCIYSSTAKKTCIFSTIHIESSGVECWIWYKCLLKGTSIISQVRVWKKLFQSIIHVLSVYMLNTEGKWKLIYNKYIYRTTAAPAKNHTRNIDKNWNIDKKWEQAESETQKSRLWKIDDRRERIKNNLKQRRREKNQRA